MSSYEKKALKYKIKYLNLKKLAGGEKKSLSTLNLDSPVIRNDDVDDIALVHEPPMRKPLYNDAFARLTEYKHGVSSNGFSPQVLDDLMTIRHYYLVVNPAQVVDGLQTTEGKHNYKRMLLKEIQMINILNKDYNIENLKNIGFYEKEIEKVLLSYSNKMVSGEKKNLNTLDIFHSDILRNDERFDTFVLNPMFHSQAFYSASQELQSCSIKLVEKTDYDSKSQGSMSTTEILDCVMLMKLYYLIQQFGMTNSLLGGDDRPEGAATYFHRILLREKQIIDTLRDGYNVSELNNLDMYEKEVKNALAKFDKDGRWWPIFEDFFKPLNTLTLEDDIIRNDYIDKIVLSPIANSAQYDKDYENIVEHNRDSGITPEILDSLISLRSRLFLKSPHLYGFDVDLLNNALDKELKMSSTLWDNYDTRNSQITLGDYIKELKKAREKADYNERHGKIDRKKRWRPIMEDLGMTSVPASVS